jgi:hypothetical protein
MRLSTTKENFEAMTDAQLVALSTLLDGRSVTDAAKAAKVSRQTVSEWKNHNPTFIAILNAGRLDVWSQVEDRLRKLTGRAIDVLEQGLENGNVSVARDVLRAAGKLELNKVGPTDPQSVRNEMDDAAAAEMFSHLAKVLQMRDLEEDD